MLIQVTIMNLKTSGPHLQLKKGKDSEEIENAVFS